MCGRFCLTLDPKELQCACKYEANKEKEKVIPNFRNEYNLGRKYEPKYNMCPQDLSPVLVSAKHFDSSANSNERILVSMLWSIIPRWHKGDYKKHGLTTNNIRIENLLTSKLYKPALDSGRRCVMLLEGFYEWQTVNKTLKSSERAAYYIYQTQEESIKMEDKTTWSAENVNLMKIAGLFDRWIDENGDSIYSYSIITFESDDKMNWLHHRAPAILETDSQISDWLDFERIPAETALKNVIKQPKHIVWHQISNYVNNWRNTSEKCNEPLDSIKKESKKSPIKSKMMSMWLIKGEQKRQLKHQEGESSKKIIKLE